MDLPPWIAFSSAEDRPLYFGSDLDSVTVMCFSGYLCNLRYSTQVICVMYILYKSTHGGHLLEVINSIEYRRVALGCTLPPVWLVPAGVYLIKFLIGNRSYSSCIEPSHTVQSFSPM